MLWAAVLANGKTELVFSTKPKWTQSSVQLFWNSVCYRLPISITEQAGIILFSKILRLSTERSSIEKISLRSLIWTFSIVRRYLLTSTPSKILSKRYIENMRDKCLAAIQSHGAKISYQFVLIVRWDKDRNQTFIIREQIFDFKIQNYSIFRILDIIGSLLFILVKNLYFCNTLYYKIDLSRKTDFYVKYFKVVIMLRFCRLCIKF